MSMKTKASVGDAKVPFSGTAQPPVSVGTDLESMDSHNRLAGGGAEDSRELSLASGPPEETKAGVSLRPLLVILSIAKNLQFARSG